MLTIQIPDHIETRLAPVAKSAGKDTTAYIHEAVTEYLMDLEDLYLAEQQLADIRSGKSKPISSEQLRKELGLED